MTIQGILLSVCFLGLSNAKPVNDLSKKRPQPNIFNFYILLSVIGQFAIHIYSLIAVTSMAKSFMPEYFFFISLCFIYINDRLLGIPRSTSRSTLSRVCSTAPCTFCRCRCRSPRL